MLIPTKYMNPDHSVLYLGGLVLKKLQKHKIYSYDDAFKIFSKNKIEDMFVPTMGFLYLLDLVEYNINSDCFIYRGGGPDEVK